VFVKHESSSGGCSAPAGPDLDAADTAIRAALARGSAAGLRVVGFGEISSAVAWPTDDARWVFKTLPTFRSVERFWRLSDGLRHGVSVRVIKGGKEWTSM